MAGVDDPRFEQIVREYAGLIRRVIAHVCGRPHLTVQIQDDIAQEVFISLWKRLKSEQPIEDPASYIFMMARREAIRALMREASRRTQPLADDHLELPSPSASPLATIEALELGRAVEAALGRLPADRARATRAHLIGLDAAEIGALTGWSYNRVRNLVSRGMLELRSILRLETVDD
jgi:RNA polymerase sigma-70 factor (ECF subfamily)